MNGALSGYSIGKRCFAAEGLKVPYAGQHKTS